jgi:hypothetical protein
LAAPSRLHPHAPHPNLLDPRRDGAGAHETKIGANATQLIDRPRAGRPTRTLIKASANEYDIEAFSTALFTKAPKDHLAPFL